MVMTDPIADFLTRIRNAKQAGHRRLQMPASKIKSALAAILRDEGYIRDYKTVDEGPQGTLVLWLKYDAEGNSAIQGIKRVSRPGLRKYVPSSELPRVLGGLGIAILSTSQGVMTGKSATKLGVGGEVLCFVW